MLKKFKNVKSPFGWLGLSIIVILIDQITKTLAMIELVSYEPLQVLPLFDLNLMYNPGMAFSLFGDGVGANAFFIAIASVVCVVIVAIFKLQPKQTALYYTGLALIMGGALGNLIDRVQLGFVIDFLDFHVGNYHWPAFNIADSAICVGAVLLIVDIFLNKKK